VNRETWHACTTWNAVYRCAAARRKYNALRPILLLAKVYQGCVTLQLRE
jgi:hypothetical protein